MMFIASCNDKATLTSSVLSFFAVTRKIVEVIIRPGRLRLEKYLVIPTQKMCVFSYVFWSEKFKENLFFSNLYVMHVEETLLPFSLLFRLKILLFWIATLHFWALF